MKRHYDDTGLTSRRINISILILTLLVVLSGCQAEEPLAEQYEQTINQITRLPDLVVRGIISLFGSISNIGEALAELVGDIVGNMTGE